MVTFPARRIIFIKIDNRYDNTYSTIYQNKNYPKTFTVDDLNKFHIRFNIFDMERKIYIAKEKDIYEIKPELENPSLKIARFEIVADAEMMPDYDYNKIWGNEIW